MEMIDKITSRPISNLILRSSIQASIMIANKFTDIIET